MNQKLQLFLLSILLIKLGTAQNNSRPGEPLAAVSAPKGNYIYLCNEKELALQNPALLNSTAYFSIERTLYNPALSMEGQTGFKKIGESRPIQTLKELSEFFTSSEIESLRTSFMLTSDDSLLRIFNSFQGWEKYDFFYTVSPRFRAAKGDIFIDKDAKEKETYVYKVNRMDKNGVSTPWGQTIVETGSGNYLLPALRPITSKVFVTDSSMAFTWQLPVNKNVLNNIPTPSTKTPFDRLGLSKAASFLPYSIKARLYLLDKGKYAEGELLLGDLNKTRDTLTYSYFMDANPEDIKSAFLVTQDEVGNEGILSDTAFGVAITNKKVPLIYSIRVTDVLNGVRIAWDQLPTKPYITGIEITRYNSRDELDSVAVIPYTDTVFTDYKVEVGQHYRYQVRALYFPKTDLFQEIPASGVGTYTKFTKPMAPYDVTIENVEGDVLLKWSSIDEPGFYGAYVYRGTSAKNLVPLAGPVFNKFYKDTSLSISGNSTYYYRILNQNLRQDTSEFSPIVSIIPNRKIVTISPSNLSYYYINGRLKIYWDDPRQMNNAITSFVLQKRKKGEQNFQVVNTTLIKDNYFEDTLLQIGSVYQYRAASVTFKGDTSEYSELSEFTLPAGKVDLMDIFFVRNIPEGIEINWPKIETDRTGYCIYRRKAEEKSFKKIATTKGDVFTYIDGTVEKTGVYVYRMSIIEKDGREGANGKSISIKRSVK